MMMGLYPDSVEPEKRKKGPQRTTKNAKIDFK